MILDKNVEINITSNNIRFYKNLYLDIKIKSIIILDINNLNSGCGIKINVKCDYCGIEKKVVYNKYFSQTNKLTDKYSCLKCAHIKTKERLLKNEGITSVLQRKDVQEKIKKTNLERYGCENSGSSNIVKEKIKKTFLKRYGVEHSFQAKDVKEKIKETNFKKYGVECSLQYKDIKDKIIKNNLELYGVEHAIQRKDVQEKIKKTNLERYGVENVAQCKDIQEKIKDTNLERYKNKIIFKSIYFKKIIFEKHKNKIKERYNNLDIKQVYENGTLDFYCSECKDYKNINIHLLHQRHHYNVNICTICNPLNSTNSFESKNEEEIKLFINDLNIETKKDRTILNGNEIDIYIPNNKIGIEHNGVYWHNEFNKLKDYHLNKTALAKEKGVKLIHIWEDDWLNKQEIVKSRLKQILNLTYNKIYARKCIVKKVSSSDSREFLNRNHLQGNVNAAVKLGLYYNDELVSLMTFGKLRKNLNQVAKEGEYELTRFANKLDTSVIGGASRLFKHFIKEYIPNRIISYADCDWTVDEQDNLYIKLGFKYIGHTGLNYWWVVDGLRENRFKFRKDKLIKEGADPSLTEVDIMHDRGCYRCFGTGNYKFEYKK